MVKYQNYKHNDIHVANILLNMYLDNKLFLFTHVLCTYNNVCSMYIKPTINLSI
jgi:hypothetical protein